MQLVRRAQKRLTTGYRRKITMICIFYIVFHHSSVARGLEIRDVFAFWCMCVGKVGGGEGLRLNHLNASISYPHPSCSTV